MYFSPATFLDSRYLRNLRSYRTGYRALRFRKQEGVSRALQPENTKDVVAVLRVIEIIQVIDTLPLITVWLQARGRANHLPYQ